MPIDYRELVRRTDLFNKRYGVKFNIEEFINRTTALDDGIINMSGDKETVNLYYKMEFRPLIKKAMLNYVENEIDSFDPWQMLREFEANVMSFYRSECKRTGEGVAPDVDAGWTQNEYLARAEQELQGINPDKKVYTFDRYMSGKLRLRDIRKYVSETGGSISPSRASTILVYAKTVKEAIDKRTGVWRFFHPFKSRAEVRDLEMLKEALSQHGIRGDLNVDLEKQPFLKDIKAEFDKDPVADVKDAIAKALKEPIPEKPESEYLYEKPSVKMEDVSPAARIDPKNKNPLEMNDFLKVGYRPNLKDITHEYEISTRLYDAVVRNKQPLSDDPKVNEAASVILMKNYMRVRLFKNMVDTAKGDIGHATELLETCTPNYVADDQEFINNFPDYVPPEIPMDIQKEKVEIAEESKEKEVLSKRIEEVSIGASEKKLV